MKIIVKCIFIVLFISSSIVIKAQNTITAEVIKISNKFYKIVCKNTRNYTANTLAYVGEEGILLIDAGYLETAEELLSKIETLGNGKLKILINTHLHLDHTGGNKLLANDSVIIIAHENVKKHLQGFYGQIRNVSPEALPDITFEDSYSVYFNNEEIKLLYFPGHTDGDIIVYFTASKIAFLGDLLLTNGFPSVESNAGGNIEQYIRSVRKILTFFPEDTRFIAGHGRDYTLDEMKQYYNMIINTTNTIRQGLKEGKDASIMIKENILRKWNVKVTNGPTADYWIGAVVASLTNKNTNPSIAEPLLNTLIKRNASAAINQYREFKKNKFNNYNFNENALNVLGYYLLGKNRVEEAIKILKLNVEEYPKAFNVYDSLGEAYMKYGDKKRAIKNYKISLVLNPDNINAVQMLKKLKRN